jgi:hypothetical protein
MVDFEATNPIGEISYLQSRLRSCIFRNLTKRLRTRMIRRPT